MQGISKLISGDSLDFATTVDKYPATDGWVLKYVLVPRFTTPTQAAITLTAATYQTSRYRVQVTPSETAAWQPGAYSWASYVEQAGQRITLEQGSELTVAPNPAAIAQGVDVRSSAEQALAAVKALLLGKATSGQASYRINGRQLDSYPMADLLMLQSQLQADVVRERRAAALAAGRPNPSRFGVRLARV